MALFELCPKKNKNKKDAEDFKTCYSQVIMIKGECLTFASYSACFSHGTETNLNILTVSNKCKSKLLWDQFLNRLEKFLPWCDTRAGVD